MPKQRASIEELHEFANAVREAGGGNPIDALMPAVPEDSERCLIARNLNFNCEVHGSSAGDIGRDRWAMTLTDKYTRDRIAKKLGLAKRNIKEVALFDADEKMAYEVILPKKIGQCAADFDQAESFLDSFRERAEKFTPELAFEKACEDYNFTASYGRKLLADMVPYIELSETEAHSIATLVNPDGSIVL